MTIQINSKKNVNNLREWVGSLQKATAALLDEVKSLGSMKKIEVGNGINFEEEVRIFEIEMIKHALEKTGGNQLRAARLLKLKHTTLNAKNKRYEIRPGRE